MNLQKIIFSLFILLNLTKFCFAQEIPKARLVLESKNVNCEILLADSDALFLELSNEPNSRGYVVIYGKTDNILKKTYYERVLEGAVEFRQFDRSRITNIRGNEIGDLRIQFWLVPTGAEKPSFDETAWDFTLSPNTKPFIFYSNSGDFDQICTVPSYNKVYTELLVANSEFRGNIVIYESSPTKFRKAKADLLKNFPETIKNRLKIFFVPRKSSIFELWLIPPKKK